jgi:hypothetical protein
VGRLGRRLPLISGGSGPPVVGSKFVAGRVDLGTWTDAEFNEVLRRYRNAAGG